MSNALFTRFNRKSIQDRSMDTLIGLAKGITADGNVNQEEAEFLMTWLIQNAGSDNPILLNLLGKVESILADGVVDKDEAQELLCILTSISGGKSEIGELAKSTTLPLCSPVPEIAPEGKTFLFTGTFAFGSRKECISALVEAGGVEAKSVNKKLGYLVIGTYVTDAWAHESFGRKIEKAMTYRDEEMLPIAIISEESWLKSIGRI